MPVKATSAFPPLDEGLRPYTRQPHPLEVIASLFDAAIADG
jgi:hypothetical protein